MSAKGSFPALPTCCIEPCSAGKVSGAEVVLHQTCTVPQRGNKTHNIVLIAEHYFILMFSLHEIRTEPCSLSDYTTPCYT